MDRKPYPDGYISEWIPAPDVTKVLGCMKTIEDAAGVPTGTKELCRIVLERAIPVKPKWAGTPKHKKYICPRCGMRIRGGAGVPFVTGDIVCRGCLSLVDWRI